MAIQNILPDPNNKITASGQASDSGNAGPGFASVKLSSDQKIMTDRTNSGRVLNRCNSYQTWSVDISYNPMTREEFDPVYAFLLEKQVSLRPFFVSLPQYRDQGITNKSVSVAKDAGAYTLTLNDFGSSDISVGALFNVSDPNDSTHTKAYMVTRVDAATNVITFTPALAKDVSSSAELDFTNPLIRVIQQGKTQNYSLNTENLYSFSLKLQEANS